MTHCYPQFKRLSFLLFISLCVPVGMSHAAELYVGPSGVDYPAGLAVRSGGNDCGDELAPCGTITHATSRAQAGDVIRLSAGIFGAGEAFPIYLKDGVDLIGVGDVCDTALQPPTRIRPMVTATEWAMYAKPLEP